MTTTDLITAIQLPVSHVVLGPYGRLYIQALEGLAQCFHRIVLNSQRTASSHLEVNR